MWNKIKKMRWVSLLLLATLFTSLIPLPVAQALEPSALQARFDSLDNAGGNWYKNATNESGGLAWNESYVMNGYMIMYEVTKDTKYLDKLVDHATAVLKMRDSERGVTDYRGLSLPAWRATGRYTLDGRPYIFAAHTGMISYPMADFARVVYKNPTLWPKYKAKADLLLKAAKDAVAVHDDEWRDYGTSGGYIFRKGAPLNTDGGTQPFNQMLALARTQLAIWQATGEQVYYNRVKKMAQTFKNNLTSDSSGAYLWHYTWGTSYNGWASSDGISVNAPNYSGYKNWEDVSHGSIDVDFAVLAYDAGIVFTEADMKKFGLTVEKKMLRSDGTVAYTVLGATVSPSASHIGRWLRLNKWAPSLFNYVNKLSLSGPTGLLAIAKLNQANLENLGQYRPTEPTPPGSSPAPTPEPGPEPAPIPEPEPAPSPDPAPGPEPTTEPTPVPEPSPAPEPTTEPTPVPDTTPPEVTLQQLDGGPNLRGNVPLQATATDDQGVSGVFFEYKPAGQTSWTKISDGVWEGTGWNCLFATPGLADGNYDLRAVAFDQAGNIGSSEAIRVTVDNTSPVLGSPVSDAFARGRILLQVAASDNIALAQVTFRYSANPNGPWEDLGQATQNGENWVLSWDTTALADGNYYLGVLAVDEAGNIALSENKLITLDNTEPVVSQPTLTPDSFVADGVAKTALTYQLSEAADVKVFIINSAGIPVQTLFQGRQQKGFQSLSWDGRDDNGPVPPGVYTFQVEAMDLAGNRGLMASAAVTLLQPKTAEAVVNGSFSDGRTGWSSGGTLKAESNGNKYITANYSFALYQNLDLKPGAQYKLNAKTRKGTAASEARMGVAFLDASGRQISGMVLKYSHKGAGWESFPETLLEVPAGTVITRLYLLVNGGTGTHDFDDISVQMFAPIIKNGDFNDGLMGWGSGGTLKTEVNGNKYVAAKYGWQLYQDLKLTPGSKYQLTALTRKGTATTEARLGLAFLDGSGKVISDVIVKYPHRGNGWENIPAQTFLVPAGTVTARLYLLVNGGTGTHDFDNISLTKL